LSFCTVHLLQRTCHAWNNPLEPSVDHLSIRAFATECVRTQSVIMVISNTIQLRKTLSLIPLQQAMTPLTPLEPGVEMFQRVKTQSFFPGGLTVRSSLERPLSHVSAYTDIEDDDSSEFEEYSGSSVRYGGQYNDVSANCHRVTTGEARRPSRHLKKYKHPQMTFGHSSPNGAPQKQ
jgi:hypothetical protein